MGIENRLLRAPERVAYDPLQVGIEISGGIHLPCTTKLGRQRVRLWHHGGMIIGARASRSDVHIRQKIIIGVAQTSRPRLFVRGEANVLVDAAGVTDGGIRPMARVPRQMNGASPVKVKLKWST